MNKLAIFGGNPVRSKPFPSWPRITKNIKDNLFSTLENDGWGVGSDAVRNFEEKYAKYHDAKYAISTSSGTTALWVSLKAAGVKAGDEVIIPPLVKVIESYAFSDNLIETVEFNDGLQRIDGRAFSINKLTSITIPASVISIGAATEGPTPASYYERFPFSYNPQIKTVIMLGSNTVIEPFFLGENNNFRMSYDVGGAGTYTGSQYGQWKKSTR